LPDTQTLRRSRILFALGRQRISQQEMNAAIDALKERRLRYRPDDPRAYRGPAEPSRVSVAGWLVYLMLFMRDATWIWLGSGTAGPFVGVAAFGMPPFPLGMVIPLVGLAGCVMTMAHFLDLVPPWWGFVGALVAFGGSAYPGVVVVGPVGILLGLAGLILVGIHPFLPRYPPAWRI
jgi:hypothetical protein